MTSITVHLTEEEIKKAIAQFVESNIDLSPQDVDITVSLEHRDSEFFTVSATVSAKATIPSVGW